MGLYRELAGQDRLAKFALRLVKRLLLHELATTRDVSRRMFRRRHLAMPFFRGILYLRCQLAIRGLVIVALDAFERELRWNCIRSAKRVKKGLGFCIL